LHEISDEDMAGQSIFWLPSPSIVSKDAEIDNVDLRRSVGSLVVSGSVFIVCIFEFVQADGFGFNNYKVRKVFAPDYDP